MDESRPRSEDARPPAEASGALPASDLWQIRRVEDRLAFATDAGDWQAFLACFGAGATGEYGALGSGPIAAIVDAIAESQGRYLGTMNFVGTHCADVAGGSGSGSPANAADWQVEHALARTYVVSHHFRRVGESGADDHVGTCYADRFVKRDGVWKIAHRDARVLWFRQDEVQGGWI